MSRLPWDMSGRVVVITGDHPHTAVAIVRDAVDRLQAAGLEVSEADRDVLVGNLLVVLCSGERAQPVLQVQAGSRERSKG